MTDKGVFDLVAPLTETIWRAGHAVMSIYAREQIAFDAKADASPVTDADKASEEIILRDLARLAPEIPVISEEAASEGHVPEVKERFFLVDPLDGTKEFITRNGEFTLNIGLIEKGVPVFGVVYAPAISQLFVTRGEGLAAQAVLEAGQPEFSDIASSPIHVRRPDPSGLTAVTSRSHMNEKTRAYLQAFNIADTVASGSSLKFCQVARGNADVYPRLARTMEWDTAAGHAVLRAAGGEVLTEDGALLRYGKKARGFDNPGFIAWGLDATDQAAIERLSISRVSPR